MFVSPVGLESADVDSLEAVTVGPGCFRRDLPSRDGIRIWVVDIEPGAQWPRIDRHDGFGEDAFVVRGELIEGDTRYAAGSYLRFGPGSSHRPRTETGVRLFGFNLRPQK